MNSEENQRDWLGDILLWSFAGTVIAVILKAVFGVGGIILAIPLAIFGFMCAAFFLSLIVNFIRDFSN